jgi:hypothetical protein
MSYASDTTIITTVVYTICFSELPFDEEHCPHPCAKRINVEFKIIEGAKCCAAELHYRYQNHNASDPLISLPASQSLNESAPLQLKLKAQDKFVTSSPLIIKEHSIMHWKLHFVQPHHTRATGVHALKIDDVQPSKPVELSEQLTFKA